MPQLGVVLRDLESGPSDLTPAMVDDVRMTALRRLHDLGHTGVVEAWRCCLVTALRDDRLRETCDAVRGEPPFHPTNGNVDSPRYHRRSRSDPCRPAMS